MNKKHITVAILTPLAFLLFCATLNGILITVSILTPLAFLLFCAALNGILITVSILTPLESYVYSKLGFHPLYDSFGVEHVYRRVNLYKHAIPLGLGFQNVICYFFNPCEQNKKLNIKV